MHKKIAGSIIGAVLLAVPLFASAQTAALPTLPANPSIAQLEALIVQLTALLQQLLAQRNSAPSVSIDQSSLTTNSAFPVISGSASNVSSIYVYVASATQGGGSQGVVPVVNGHWSAPLIAKASTNGFSTGTYTVTVHNGLNGPVLATGTLVIATNATTSMQTSSSLSVSPTSGVAPLSVTFKYSKTTGDAMPSPSVSINYGDGTTGILTSAGGSCTGGFNCVYSYAGTHAYNSAGTYLAMVSSTASTTITVTNTTSSVTLKSSIPTPLPYSIVAAGNSGVVIGSFVLQTTGDSVNLQRVALQLNANSASSSDLSNGVVTIWNGSTQVGTASFNGTSPVGGYYTATTTLVSPVLLTQNVQTTFTLKTDISNIGLGQPGTAGHLIRVNLADATGPSVNNGGILVHSGPTAAPIGIRIFKTYPIVAQIPLKSVIGGVNTPTPLMRYSVTANSSGPVGLLWQGFSLVDSGASVSNIQLAAFTDAAFSQPVSAPTQAVVSYQGTCTGTCGPAFWYSSPIEIPAGNTYYFEVLGTVAPTATNFNVTTTLHGDSSYTFPQTRESDAFDWSPNDNGTSLQATNDWTNGYGVTGLPAIGISQTLTGTGSISQLTATPTSGTVPLSVTFSNVGSAINFGDGTGEAASNSALIGQVTHIYKNPGTYTAASGNSSMMITVTAPPPPPPSLSATLTANGVTTLNAKVGDTIAYRWSSQNATAMTSTFTEDSSSCGLTGTGPFSWVVATTNGSNTGTIVPCQTGHTYTISAVASNAAGQQATSTVTVAVATTTTACTNPPPQVITNSCQQVGYPAGYTGSYSAIRQFDCTTQTYSAWTRKDTCTAMVAISQSRTQGLANLASVLESIMSILDSLK